MDTAGLNRYATQQITLSDGTIIPKGANIAVSAHTMMEDGVIYDNATTYDGLRFYNMRQEPGSEHRHQLVTTTPEHFAFGLGKHACPGRFFAANESKILLLHLVMKYDWKLQSGGRPKNYENGFELITDPTVEMLFRTREPEINLAFLGE
jgi:cytochrome P450